MKHFHTNTQRVAFNTLSLYVNMIVTMLATLLATRYVLQALGKEEYGIYMLIASMVALFSFLNITMAASVQRYLSHAMGANKQERVHEVFYMSVVIHLGIALIVGALLLILGIYAIDNMLDIPISYHYSAKLVLLCMTVGMCAVVNSVSYEAAMNAHEDIVVIAAINIVEALLKLGAAVLVLLIDECGIVCYAFFFLLAQIMAFVAKFFYCWYHYDEAHFHFHRLRDRHLLQELFSYAGWSLIGTTCGMARYQGSAILLNVFFGVFVNAAYGVAQQVNGFLLFFAGSIVRPLRPLVIKMEGAGLHDKMLQYSFTVSRVTFVMLCMAVIPLYINMPYILSVWLDSVPDGALEFSRMFLLIVLINQATVGLQVALESVGRIRRLQIIVGSMHIVAIPIGYILFQLGFSALSIMYCVIAEEIVCTVLRIWVAWKDAGIRPKAAYLKMVFPEFLVFIVAYSVCYILAGVMHENFLQLFLTTLTSLVVICILSYAVCFSSFEREKVRYIWQTVKKKVG